MSYKQLSRNKWQVRFYYKNPDTGKRSEKKIFAESKTKCSILKKNFLKELEEITKKKKDNKDNITINELYPLYTRFKSHSYKGSTMVTNKRRLEKEILPFFGKKRIYDITSKDVVDWKETIDNKGYSLQYSRSLYNLLSNLFKFAMSQYKLKSNPVTSVGTFKRPDEIKKELQYWTYEEFKSFYEVADNEFWKLLFATLYFTGMRKGELQALKWSDVDFKSKRIKISKTLTTKTTTEEKKNGILFKITPPKTKTSNRSIIVPDFVLNCLKRHYSNESQVDGFDNECYVFGTTRFTPDTSINRYKNKYVNMSSVTNIRIHDFRHSHASYLINNGANIMVVSSHLGHSDVKETLNTYSHMFPDFEHQIVDFMNENIDL